MGFFDFLFKGDKKHFKQTQKSLNDYQQDDITSTEEYQMNLKLIKMAKIYTKKKEDIISKGINIYNESDSLEKTIMINDFITSTLEQLPSGTVIPVNISFKRDDKEQVLILGKEIISSSLFVKKEGSKPRHGILRHDNIAILVDSDKAPNILNPGITNRITIEDEESSYLINLITNDFLTSKTQMCRFSNIEFNFANWEKSLDQIKNIGQTPYIVDFQKALPRLDTEITNNITNYLEKLIEDIDKKLENDTPDLEIQEDKIE